MKTLIVEDDFASRFLMLELLKTYGVCHSAENGIEAVNAVSQALNEGEPYDLICLDIMMPDMDGQEALKQIRSMEEKRGILSTKGSKILMTTALDDLKNVSSSFYNLCDGYIVKPIEKEELVKELKKLKVAL